MANENKLIIQTEESDQNNNQSQTLSGSGKRSKYLVLAILLFIAVFIYDVSPLDLMPFLPFDDIAVTFGGTIGMIALFMKYFAKRKQN